MIVNFKKKFSVIHIPKTGGTSIKKSLKEENLEKDVYFFHKKKYVYPAFLEKTKIIRQKLKYSHLTLDELNNYYPELFKEIKNFELYTSIREPWSRFKSSLIQYFGEKNINLANINVNEMDYFLKKIISDLNSSKFNEDISLTSFKKQSDYIFFKKEKIVKNIYTINNLDKLTEHINKKHGIYFNKIKKQNISPKIIYNPLPQNKYSKFFPKIIKKNMISLYNLFVSKDNKIFESKYSENLNSYEIKNFVLEYYMSDFDLYKFYNKL